MRRREFMEWTGLVTVLLVAAQRRIGDIRFCRVAHASLLAIVPRGCVAEVDSAIEGITLLGTHATLVVDRSGCFLFPASEGAFRK